MALYTGQPRWAGTRTLRNVNRYTTFIHCPQIPHKQYPPRPPIIPLWYYTRKNPETELKETRRTRGTSPDLMRPVNRWSRLTHASHQMTTSLPAVISGFGLLRRCWFAYTEARHTISFIAVFSLSEPNTCHKFVCCQTSYYQYFPCHHSL